MSKKRYRACYVKWRDTTKRGDRWLEEEDMADSRKRGCLIFESRGFLTDYNDVEITIVQSVSMDAPKVYGELLKIPRGCIIKMTPALRKKKCQ